MTTAAAIATLVELAGVERVAVAVGTGFTGRYTLGQRPLPWARVAEYVTALRALLRGETVLWEGGKMRMMHPAGFGTPRPIEVPILLGAAGPKGIATAREVGDGVFIAGAPCVPGFAWRRGCSSAPSSTTARPTRRHASSTPPAMRPRSCTTSSPRTTCPSTWFRGVRNGWPRYSDVPADERHLAIHDLHLIGVNERDRDFIVPEPSAPPALSTPQLNCASSWRGSRPRAPPRSPTSRPDPTFRAELEAFAKAAVG